jgi:aspartate/methionine/tyrosine aminotransferase
VALAAELPFLTPPDMLKNHARKESARPHVQGRNGSNGISDAAFNEISRVARGHHAPRVARVVSAGSRQANFLALHFCLEMDDVGVTRPQPQPASQPLRIHI